ncbi:UDP-N-acetylenolpyruvoylglucosamine reductase, partial [Trueperella sp. LYQ143]
MPSPRWVVLSVLFHVRRATLSRPVGYGQLADVLGVEVGQRVPSAEVRAAVLELRRSKGMVLDDSDRDTYSLGSFFTNPVLSPEQA